MFGNLATALKRVGSSAKFFWQAKHPTIIFIGGLISGAMCIYEVVKSSIDAKDIIEKHTVEFEKIKDAQLNPEKYENADHQNLVDRKNKEILLTAKDLGKLYFKAIIWGGVSLALLTTGHLLECKKAAENAALAAATAASLNVVDSNLRKIFGAEHVNMFHDPNLDTDSLLKKYFEGNEDEEEITRKYDSIATVPNEERIKPEPEEFNTFIYDSRTVEPNLYYRSPVNAIMQLTMIQNALNAKLHSGAVRGLTLNDVLQEIGFQRKAMPAYGQFTGWCEDDYISFGLESYTNILGMHNAGGEFADFQDMIKNAQDEGIYLRLNPTGPVGDRIFNNKFVRRKTT